MTVIKGGRRIPIYTKGRKDRIGDDFHWQKATGPQPRNVDQAKVEKRRKANKAARKQRKRTR